MNKKSLSKAAALGLLAGLAASCSGGSNTTASHTPASSGAKEMAEGDLLSVLDQQGKALYYSLDEDGKALARRLASQSCAGSNECAGLNSCKGPNNECAGMGSCKGSGSCAFADKNVAVKIAVKHSAEQRAKGKY